MAESEEKTINVQDKSPIDTGGAESISGGQLFYPPIDIWEDDGGLHIEAEMPGVDSSGISVDLKENTLTILGKVPLPKSDLKLLREEFELGDFYRQFTVSDLIDQEGITAKIKDGVLAIYLPKQAPAQPRKIQVVAE
ncbi:MAG: Hsp20/alpha crystallin family protein [Deltaproteobacteria bacterium]|jgi:HSP20 family protein|nr:Hsp20/alpha crystallin family protein [Deltaproteobacteria bacterium]